MNKWIRTVALMIGMSSLLGYGLACNTAEGIGKDTQKVGDKIEDAADRNK